MINLAVYLFVLLIVVGVLLWAVDNLPWMSADIKKLMHILIVVVAVLLAIGIVFPGWHSLRP